MSETSSREGEDVPNHQFTEHLDYQGFKMPILFRVTSEGEDTILPSIEIPQILKEEFGLDRGDTFDSVGGGISPDEKSWWGYAFDGGVVDDPEEVINAIQELIDNCNEPPEDLPEQGKIEWKKSTVIMKDIYGINEGKHGE